MMILASLLAALALGIPAAAQAPRPSTPPPHGECRFDAPAFWGVGIDGLVTAARVEREVRLEFSPRPGAADFDAVIFDARINEQGQVTSACVLHSVQPDVDAAALTTLKRWSFRPARLKDAPHTAVPVVQTVAVKVRRFEELVAHPEGKNLKEVLLFGFRMPAASLADVPESLQPDVVGFRRRQEQFRSQLTRPAQRDWEIQVAFEKRLSVERTISALLPGPEIAKAALDFAATATLPYEWEGDPDAPLAEAKSAASFLVAHPDSPAAPYLHLFIAHRHLCAASYQRPSALKDAELATFRAELEIAMHGQQPLITYLARQLRLHPVCADR
jgi:TonB family protein